MENVVIVSIFRNVREHLAYVLKFIFLKILLSLCKLLSCFYLYFNSALRHFQLKDGP